MGQGVEEGTAVWELVGEGGYEGLSAILVQDESDDSHPFVGLIFSGGVPPLPEAPAAE
jgi:hypothetical protein